jgi:phosphatidylglycerol:prolipoprotein diacylglycerol transferase
MLPILFRIPLPRWTLPLGPALAVLFVLGVLILAVGWRRKARELRLIGGAFASLSALAALLLGAERYALGPVSVQSFGALLGASLVIGWHLTLRLGERDGFSRELLSGAYFVAVLAGFAGARLLYVLANPSAFSGLWDILAVRRGGLNAYGALIGGLLGSWWYLRRRSTRLTAWLDLTAPSVASGVALTRLGCYAFGCDFGRPLTAGAPAWLERLGTFPRWAEGTHAWASGSPAWLEHVAVRGLSPLATASLPVHPTQLYEAIGAVLLLALVFKLRARARFHGQVFLTLALGYGALRFWIEALRDDAERGLLGPRLAAHWLVLAGLLLIGAACALGPARSVGSPRRRRALQIAVLLPGLFAALALRPASGERALQVEPSISLWLALATAVASAVAWRRLEAGVTPS